MAASWPRCATRLDARRGRRGGLGDLLARLLGMDLKLRQYELGKAFCDAVAAAGGDAALQTLWSSADRLPSARRAPGPRALARARTPPRRRRVENVAPSGVINPSTSGACNQVRLLEYKQVFALLE